VSHASNYIQVRGYGNATQYFQVYDSKASAIRMQVGLDTGRVGIGTTTLSQHFEAYGDINDAWAGKFTNANPGGYGGLFIISGSTANDYAFEIRTGTSNTVMKVMGTGDVGIGTASPAARFHVYDSDVNNGRIGYMFKNVTDGNYVDLYVGQSQASGKTGIIYYKPGANITGSFMALGNYGDSLSNGEGLIIQYGGNVGIGTTTPVEKLALDGTNPRIFLDDATAPGTTTNRLYSVAGQLFWNGLGLTSYGVLPTPVEGNVMRGNGTSSWQATSDLFIEDTGMIGIGTTNPSQKLHTFGTSDTYALLGSSGASADLFHGFENSGDGNNS
jgi:hypothetical protein